MKKIFTLISMALVAMSVNAQDKVYSYTAATVDGLSSDFSNVTDSKGRSYVKVNKDGMPIIFKAVSGKLPANAEGGAQKITPDLESPVSGRDNTYNVKSVEEWTAASFNANNKFTDWNSIDPKYNMYFAQGTGNPYTRLYAQEIIKEGDPTGTYKAEYDYYVADGSNGLPATGTYYKFTPKANGTLKIAIFAGKGRRQTFFIEESSKLPIPYTVEGYIMNQKYPSDYSDPALVGKAKLLTNDEINAIATEASSGDFVIGHWNAHFYGWLTATVEKGKSYYLFLHNGQMGVSGFEFTYDESGVDSSIDEVDEIASSADPTIITAIETVKNIEKAINANAPIYNLAGQKVDKNQKGILIQNGKKFVNK